MRNYLEEVWGNKKLIMVSLFFLLGAQFLLQYKQVLWPKLYMLLAVLAIFLLFTFCRLNNEKKIAWNAFILIIIFGSLNALILPIRQNLDENTHFFHALEMSDGKWRQQSTEEKYLEISPDFLAVTKLPSIPEYGSVENTNLYSKEFKNLAHIKSDYKPELLNPGTINNPAYVPSALGISLGKLISNKVFVYYYLGRIFNLLFFAIAAFFAINISKKYKIELFIIATIPYTLWICAGYSYDSLYYGLILLVLAQLSDFLSEHAVSLRQILWYSLTCFLLVLCKAPTILLVFLPIFLPLKYYQSKNERIKAVIIMLISLILSFIWMIQGSIMNLFNKSYAISSSTGSSTIGGDRLNYFMHHIKETIAVFLRSISDIIANIGQTISHPEPFFMRADTLGFINFSVFVFFIALVGMKNKLFIPRKLFWGIIAIASIISLGTIYAITGDPRVFKVGDLHVSGVQGRYHYYLLGLCPILIKYLMHSNKCEDVVTFLQSKSIMIDNLIVKTIFLVTVLNSTVALYGYL